MNKTAEETVPDMTEIIVEQPRTENLGRGEEQVLTAHQLLLSRGRPLSLQLFQKAVSHRCLKLRKHISGLLQQEASVYEEDSAEYGEEASVYEEDSVEYGEEPLDYDSLFIPGSVFSVFRQRLCLREFLLRLGTRFQSNLIWGGSFCI